MKMLRSHFPSPLAETAAVVFAAFMATAVLASLEADLTGGWPDQRAMLNNNGNNSNDNSNSNNRQPDSCGLKRPSVYWTTANERIDVGCVRGIFPYSVWDPFRIQLAYYVFDRADQRLPSRVLSWNHSFAQNDHSDEEKLEKEQEQNLFVKGQLRVAVIVHGFTESANSSWVRAITGAYFKHVSATPLSSSSSSNLWVINVEWSRGAAGAQRLWRRDYVQAAANVPMVARITAEFLTRLMKRYFVTERQLHLIGHSLGAHVVGETARWLHRKHGIMPGRVTALEPAAPLFRWRGTPLNRRDTHFLEVIHTSAALSLTATLWGAVGLSGALGDVDLYPNGGVLYQPACRKKNTFFCSHNRGRKYYTDMLARCTSRCDFSATRCKDEAEATQKRCSGTRFAKVCAYLDWKANLDLRQRARPSNPSAEAATGTKPDVLYFDTDSDQVSIECR